MNNFQKSQQALIGYIRNETEKDPFCNNIGDFIDSNIDLQNFAKDCIDDEDDSVFNQGNASDLNLLEREVDRLLAPLTNENSIAYLPVIRRSLVAKLREKYDQENGNDKAILKDTLNKQKTNFRIFNEKNDEFSSMTYLQNTAKDMTLDGQPSVFIYPDKNSPEKFKAILRVSIPEQSDADNPNRMQRKIVNIDITKDLEKNENFSDAWRTADDKLLPNDEKIIKDIAQKKTEKAIIDSMTKESPLDEFKQRIGELEQLKSGSVIKHTAPILQVLDDILENRAMTVEEYEELRDNILSGRVKGLTDPPASVATAINEKLQRYEQNMLIKPEVSMIDQQEVVLLEDKIKMVKTDRHFNTEKRPTFLEFNTKEQLLHKLSTTYPSFVEGTPAYELAGAIFTEALGIYKETRNSDLAYDIVYDFLKFCQYAEKTVQDKGLTGDARNKEVFRQLTARLEQQKNGTARINDKDPNDRNSEELSENEYVRKPTKGVYTKIGGFELLGSKAGRNIDKIVNNLKDRLYPEQKKPSIWKMLFGGWNLNLFGSDKTKNSEEQNSKHIQEELGSLQSTSNQTDNDMTKIEMAQQNKDVNHVTASGIGFHEAHSTPNQQKDANDGETHNDQYNPTN